MLSIWMSLGLRRLDESMFPSFGKVSNQMTQNPQLTHFHTMTPFDAPWKQAF